MAMSFYDSAAGRIELEVSDDVYPPQEDSFMLAKAVEGEAEWLGGRRILEVGCGSGLLSILASRLSGSMVDAVDLNPLAVSDTLKNSIRNAAAVNAWVSDLFSAVSDSYDIIIFNAPYLPCNDMLPGDGGALISAQWSMRQGKGNVITMFLEQALHHLRDRGVVLILFSSLSGDVAGIARCLGYDCEIIDRKKIEWEELLVARLMKK